MYGGQRNSKEQIGFFLSKKADNIDMGAEKHNTSLLRK